MFTSLWDPATDFYLNKNRAEKTKETVPKQNLKEYNTKPATAGKSAIENSVKRGENSPQVVLLSARKCARASHELCFYLCALWQAHNVDIPCNFQTPMSIWEKCKKGKYNKCRCNCNSTKGNKSKVSVLCVKSFSLHRLARLESLSGSSLVLEVQHTEWFEIFCLFSAHYEKQMETWCLKPFICKRLM